MPDLPFRWLVIELTQACNHRCSHCYNYWAKNRDTVADEQALPQAEIVRIANEIRKESPIEQIALSGGEPLLRKDTPEIAANLQASGFAIIVISNMTGLDSQLAMRFPAGTVFEMTLFSTDPVLHDKIAGKKGAMDLTLKGAVNAHKAGHKLALSIVINALNAQDVAQVAKLGIAMGVQAILLNRINLTPWLITNRPELVPTKIQLQQVFDETNALAGQCETQFGVAIPVPPCIMDIGKYPNLHFGFCPRGGKDAYYTVSVNGDLRPCNHSSVILGNLKNQKFSEIILANRTQSFWQTIPQECQACRLPQAAECKGGCPAAADECYGSLNQLDPFIKILKGINRN